MNRKILGAVVVVPVMGLALAACGQQFRVSTPDGTATCSINGNANGGACSVNGRTFSVAPGAGSSVKNTPPVASPPVTVTPSDTPTTTVALGPCSVSLQQSDMEALATSEATRENLMTCMQIPQANLSAMDQGLAQYALSALNSGDFQTQDGRRRWADSQLSGAYHQWG